MGNFGKRVLIIFICVITLVTLTLVGNAYQQSEKLHKVSNASTVVASGNYSGVSYSVNKSDVLNSILSANALDLVENYFFEKLLLTDSVKSSFTDDQVSAKIKELTYGTSDDAEIEKLDNKDALKESFDREMELSGYKAEGGTEGHTYEDYALLVLAKEAYIRSLFAEDEDGKIKVSVGGVDYEINREDVEKEWKNGNGDAKAIVVKFYSSSDFSSFLRKFNNDNEYRLSNVSSVLRVFIGDSIYMPKTDDDGNYVVNSIKGLSGIVNENEYQYVEDKEGNKQYVPFVSSLKKTDGEYVYHETVDGTYKGFLHSNTTDTSRYMYKFDTESQKWKYGLVEEYKVVSTDPETGDETKAWVEKSDASFSSIDSLKCTWDQDTTYYAKNTAVLSADLMLKLYIEIYNEFYASQKTQLKEIDDVTTALILGLASEQEINTKLNEIGYALVEGEIRKYVGNEEYQVEVDENGVAKSKDGKPVYKTYNDGTDDENLPNYEVSVVNNKLVYKLDSEGERISKKVLIKDATIGLNNTIAINKAELYSVYVQLSELSELNYNYDSLSSGLSESDNRYSFLTELFTTLSEGGYYSTAKSISSGTPYYMIYKLSNSVNEGTLETSSDEYKEVIDKLIQEKIEVYTSSSSFVNTAFAELFKEAGIQFYDVYLAYDYRTDLKYDEDENAYGLSDSSEYYKSKSYNAKKIARLSKSVEFKVGDVEVKSEKITITTDELYNYAMSRSENLYVLNSCLAKVLVSMPENEQLHGKYNNYLTSDNWRVKMYVNSMQQFNVYYEYGYLSSYGYDFNSISEALYGYYHVKNYDQLVESYVKNSDRKLMIYNALVDGDLTSTTTNELFDKVTFEQDSFTSLIDDYYDVSIKHVLVYFDLDENDSADNYDDLYQAISDGSTSLRKDGNVYTLDDLNDLLDRIYHDLLEKIYKAGTLSSTSYDCLTDYVSDYENSLRCENEESSYEYSELWNEMKSLGIHLKCEEVDTTSANETKYVEAWRGPARELYNSLKAGDSVLPGYSIRNDFVQTVYGEHFMVGVAGSSFNATSFAFNDEGYGEGVKNTSADEKLTKQQLILYIQNQIYSTLFGTSGKCAQYAYESGFGTEDNKFDYPAFPQTLLNNIKTVYGDYLEMLLDDDGAYFSTYLLLQSSDFNDSKWDQLKEVYEKALFE